MRAVPIKNWFHLMHWPEKGKISCEIRELFHDRAFWAIVVTVGLVLLFTLIVAYSIWALPEGQQPYRGPTGPWYPYMR